MTIARTLLVAALPAAFLVSHAPAAYADSDGAESAQATVLGTEAPRAFFNVGAGYQLASDDLTRHFAAFTEQYAEEGSVDANYGNGSGFLFDVVGGARVVSRLSVGVGVSYARTEQAADVDARVPHPFFFQRLRSATFVTSSLRHTEIGLHIPIMWTQPLSESTQIAVFGGPSYLRTSQDFVSGVTLTEVYPYDEVTIGSTSQTSSDDSAWGFHAGADFSLFFSDSTGVGVGVRYTRATVDFAGDSPATTSGRAGGLQVSGGLRLRF